MASPSQSSVLLLLLLLLFIASAAGVVSSATNSHELTSMLQAVRNHGYTLFANAITTSDIQYELLTAADAAASPFTLFAPKDELLFALDMAADAAVYVSTLRYHVIPNHRRTFADLQNLSAHFLDTLLPHYAVLIGKVRDGYVSTENETVGVMVDGVRVSIPDLFLGSRIAVHGIDGILLTGLSMNQDFDDNDNASEIFPPAESPAPGLDRNIPAEGTHAPMSQFVRSTNGLAAPPSTFDANIPSEGSPTPVSEFDWNDFPPAPASTLDGNIPAKGTHAPTSEFNWSIHGSAAPVDGNIPAEGIPSPTSEFDWNNVPVAPASTVDRNIPAEGIPTSTSQFDWDDDDIVPVARASTFYGNIPADGTFTPAVNHFDWNNVPGAFDRNIPAVATPKILEDQIEKLKSLAKKKRANHHRKGRRHHRRHRAVGDHLLGDE